MKKGIIIEMDERFLTLLTPDGEFLRARKLNQDYEIGQEIEFVPIRTKKRQKKSFFTLSSLQMKAALVASIALIAAILLPFYNGNKVYAYMTIDINPSIEIGVNKNMDVIKLAAYNDEGKSIINELTDWKRKDISTVMKLILNKSKERDYINDRDQVLIATVYEGKQKNKFEEKLDSCIKEIKIVLKKEDLLLKVIEGTTEDRIKAKEKGLSTGRYIERKQQKFMENKTKKSEHKKETKEEENKLEPSSDQVEKENKEIEEPNPTTAPPNSNGQGNNKENVPINHQHHEKNHYQNQNANQNTNQNANQNANQNGNQNANQNRNQNANQNRNQNGNQNGNQNANQNRNQNANQNRNQNGNQNANQNSKAPETKNTPPGQMKKNEQSNENGHNGNEGKGQNNHNGNNGEGNKAKEQSVPGNGQ
ncbi:anti-sigma factor domain-containing protein [Bacillus aquiflavi]|uniref:Anti-sigma factor domain-containing protein n=1 Tax=Bacillus aquiflavi TaxID=2672567 RepID=A0A6B3VY91_9BACI|nr:anti-sigma factor domain-containing protein [Bacillus aquiflavi]MBA4538012.1 anti-sigma factor domain-containing protein [Bacillus aquiflavi]NEY82268.1 anti-sigma factor domain-containing protein [Bacillus aquiflavi]